MATSLAKQLQQLQIPITLFSAAASVTEKKASFLFDAKDAADIDNETVFSIGVNGLEELMTIEPAFSAFENLLFSESSKSLERTLQSKEWNEKLDKHIEKFLKYLSPYFMLKPSHKTLEWLIRRFQIHVFNVDSLMTCVLPYHETNLFVRLVQILPLKVPSSKWHWLLPIQEASKPLSKTAFLQHCISDVTFLSLICNMVTDSKRLEVPSSSSRVLFSFYTATVVGILDMMPTVTEKFLTHLLPYLLENLKSHLSELQASSYMIIAQLCLKCRMEEKLIKSLLENICKNLKPQLVVEGLCCITYICQSQDVKELSKRTMKALLKVSGLVKIFHHVSSTHIVTPLLDIFVPQLVATGLKNAISEEPENSDMNSWLDVAEQMIQDVEFEKSSIVILTRTLLEEYCHQRDIHDSNKNDISRLNTKVKVLMEALQKKYPTELEKAIELHMDFIKGTADSSEGGTNQKALKWTTELISFALTMVKSQVIPDSSTTLFLSLHHPQAEVRQMAVKRLGELLRGKEELSEDKEFITEALLSRLHDDNPIIVSCVLKLGQMLPSNLPAPKFVEEMFKLLKKKSSEWEEVRNEALILLVGDWINSADCSLVDRIVFGLLPFLILNQRSKAVAIPMLRTISGSVLASKHVLLHGMKNYVKRKDLESCEINNDPKLLAVTNGLFFHWLGENLLKLDDQNIIKVVQDMIIYAKSCKEESTFEVMLKCFLGEAVSMISSQCKMQFCQAVMEYVLPDLWEVTRMKGNCELPWDKLAVEKEQGCKVPITLLESLTKFLGKNSTKRLDQVKGALTLWLSDILIKTLPATSDPACGKWWISKDDSKLIMLLFEVIAFGSGMQTLYQEQFKELLKNLFEFHLSDKLTMLKFLRYQWCKPPQRDNKSTSYLLQVQCLHIANTYLTSASQKNDKDQLKITSIVVPALLVPLVSPVTGVRKSAMTCITSVKTCISSVQGGHIDAVLGALVDNAEELTADPNQLSRVLGEYFSPLMSPCKPKAKMSGEVKIIKNSLNYILQSVTCSETPTYVRRMILSSLREVVTQDMVMKLLPVLEQLLKKCENDSVLHKDEILLLQLIVEKYTPQTADLLKLGSLFWEMLERVLQQRTSVCMGHFSPMVTALGQITDRFFQAIIGEELQMHLLGILVDSLLETRDVDAGNAVKTTISNICLKADMVIKELVKFNPKKESKLKKRKVKRIQREDQDESSEVSHHLKRTTAVLELLQHKMNVEEPHLLLPTLFAILTSCVELDHSQAASEYIMQLVFSLINRICQKLSLNSTSGLSGLVPEDQFDVELIIQCIRSSESPQTHNQALLLLATAAKLFPEKVLHNVMTIFTFMGASVMRQDDSYSFEVITKTLDTVIPALIQAGKKEQLPQFAQKSISSLDNVVTMLIRVFVDASPHIPEHRQLPLFTHLVNTVGSEQFLHTAVLLLLEKHVVCSPNNSDDHKQVGLKNPLGAEFCLNLCHSFDSNVQVKAILRLLQYIDSLPCEKLEVSHKPKMSRKTASSFLNVTPVFDVNVHSAKQLRQFIYTSLSIIPSLLDSGSFSSKVHDEMLNAVFLRLLEDTLTFMAKTAQRTEQAPHDVTGKFLKALLNKAYEIVDKINFLLPTSVFFDMIKGLLHSNSGTVRRKAMGLLNSNLGYYLGSYSHDQIESLLNLVTELLAISKAERDAQESVINRQTALYSLKLLSRLLAKDHPNQFKDVMSTTIEVFSAKDTNVQVVSSALLCVAEVVGGLKAHAIPFLPQFVPTVIKLIKRNEKDRNSLLSLCGVTALSKVTVSLPHFLSPYLVDILFQVTRLSSEGCGGDNQVGHIELAKHASVDDQLKERLILLRKSIAQNVAPRVLISAVSECYHKVIAQQKEQVATLMILLAECVTVMKKDDVKTYQSNLLNLFLEALDFRVQCNQEEDENLIDKTEGKVIEAFMCLVIKLSEASFRPMFFRLIDWATRPVSPKARLLVFYRLCDSVAEKLKSLFVLFAGYILKNCATVLDATNFSKTGESFFPDMPEDKGVKLTCLLLNYLLGCLHKCFMYDTHGFLDNDHFHCLMQPLVDQIENRLGGDAEFKERISRCLAPCLARFAVAAGNDAQWKPLNYQVLLKTRDKSSVVRLGALKVLEEFHARLGEDFMVLLPETIPFLAELMEDEYFEVEQQCQHVINEMEKALGEPLQKYF
ncbi:HEAT repeat-containing protein 1-like isoform X2 [Acropora millepora]|uniref:HEAT repeat-containing protein 1-like isoform X2 n=1 Tax=Acropora millepora TaxID=45264 RepID=UPI001CF359DD|nr:HEAT repeat-containing protein 1-like isoform X2 [Acropora millepora]